MPDCGAIADERPQWQLLQDVQLSHIFPDSKTFVDKPTNGSLNSTLQAFAALGNNITVGQIAEFVSANFVRIPFFPYVLSVAHFPPRAPPDV